MPASTNTNQFFHSVLLLMGNTLYNLRQILQELVMGLKAGALVVQGAGFFGGLVLHFFHELHCIFVSISQVYNSLLSHWKNLKPVSQVTKLIGLRQNEIIQNFGNSLIKAILPK